jgi:hypothetical protein
MNIIKSVLDSKWIDLKSDIEKKVFEKINQRISDKKVEVLAKLNNVDVDKMKEIINIKKD